MRGLSVPAEVRLKHSGRVRLFQPPHQKLVHVKSALFFVTIYAVAVYALLIGIDFGTHWDDPIHYRTFLFAYRSEMFLPRYYTYPSMIFWIGAASVADKLLPILYSGIKPEIPFDFGFFVFTRAILSMLISSLGAWWVFLALRCSDPHSPSVGGIGGSMDVLSWEFGYHARSIAPDLVTANSSLCLFSLLQKRREWKTRAVGLLRPLSPQGWPRRRNTPRAA